MDGARSLLTLTNVEDSYTKVCLSDEYAARMAAEQCMTPAEMRNLAKVAALTTLIMFVGIVVLRYTL